MRHGMPIPEKIQNAPELWFGLELYYRGFLDLTSARQMTSGIGPISLLTMIEYCNWMRINGEQREDFIWLMTRIDQKYIEWSRNRVKPS